ncbi:acetyltransferase (GNAT) family protein [Metarhizium guizhouense ARSEF 977]|uniref:Acetyltransferase (GNAT) family protein n=1 Tax=Metarhizium guizhouense (strain ARSEF 977) TaxID=1276136 RepID=A0A0B4H5M6_METGA|nr:acetyltransferase (GNAT) family protein [Metarhizium guizhouense ARSEF 977]
MPQTNQFHIRPARSAGDDAQFIMAAFDSTIPYLRSIGAAGMWGEKPFSEKDIDGFEQETVESVHNSEREDDPLNILIAEADRGQRPPTRVALAMIREDSLPAYITEREEMKPEVDQAKQFIFLEVVISDYGTTPLHKGAGAALIEAAKRRGREKNKDTLYYEGRGFEKVGDFSFARANGEIWPGTLFRMRLSGP